MYSLPTELPGKPPPASGGDVGDLGGSLSEEDILEEGMAAHSSILAWRIPWTEGLAGYSPWDHKESDITEGT